MTTPAKLKLQRLARKQQAEALKSKSVGKRKCKFNNPDCTWGKCFCTKSIGKKKPVGEKKVTVIQCPICWVVCRENIYKKHIKSHKEYDKGCDCFCHAFNAYANCFIDRKDGIYRKCCVPVSSKCECDCHPIEPECIRCCTNHHGGECHHKKIIRDSEAICSDNIYGRICGDCGKEMSDSSKHEPSECAPESEEAKEEGFYEGKTCGYEVYGERTPESIKQDITEKVVGETLKEVEEEVGSRGYWWESAKRKIMRKLMKSKLLKT